MPSKLHFALATTAACLVAACQTEPRLTSTNPLLQSEESQALRAAINGASIRWNPSDTQALRNCNVTLTFAKSGDLLRESRCKDVPTLPGLWSRDGATGGKQIGRGSWTVRDGTVCMNYFSVEGVPTDDASKEAGCVPARFSGNSGIFAGTQVTIVARGS